MFSNKLIRKLASSSDEHNLRLSENDWQLVLEANKSFSEEIELWKGNKVWGKYLLNKIGDNSTPLNFKDSLELCCGNGFLFFSFKDVFNLNDNSHFIDLSKSQTDAFVERCKTAGITLPDIICGDIGNLHFENDSLQMVYGNSFLHHLPDVGKYLREVNRVLKKGGRFIAFHEPTPTAVFFESFPRSIFRNLDTGSLTDIWVLRADVISRLLQDAGFRKIDIYPSNILFSFFITPLLLVLAKLGLSYQGDWVPVAKSLMDKFDKLIPNGLRMRFAPSIAIVATK